MRARRRDDRRRRAGRPPAGAGQRHARGHPHAPRRVGGQHRRVARAPRACRSRSWAASATTPAGAEAAAALRAVGVETALHLAAPGVPTGACVVLIDAAGERTMLPDAGANALLPTRPLPAGRPPPRVGLQPAASRQPPGGAGRARWPRATPGMTTSVDPASAAPLAEVGGAAFRELVARRHHDRRDTGRGRGPDGRPRPGHRRRWTLLAGPRRGGAEARRATAPAGRRRRAAARPPRPRRRTGRSSTTPARATRSPPPGSPPAGAGRCRRRPSAPPAPSRPGWSPARGRAPRPRSRPPARGRTGPRGRSTCRRGWGARRRGRRGAPRGRCR